MTYSLDLIQTIFAALVILFLGYFINAKVQLLSRNNIPEPVVGGVAFAIVSALLYFQIDFQLQFDETLKQPLMLMFFTTVGLGASFKLLKLCGPKVLVFLGVATLYLICQNAIGVAVAWGTDLHPVFGLLAGSITLSGGHGTGATYAELFHGIHNVQGSMEIAMACATFGLVLGGVIGGPVTRRLIRKHGLKPDESEDQTTDMITFNPEDSDNVTPRKMLETLLILGFCLVVGGFLYSLFQKVGLPIPSFIAPLLVGIAVTNLCEATKVYSISKECIDLWGTMSLSLFLALALMSLRLWELANLAGPMLLLLACQTAFLAFFASTVTFRLMGKNYDAAIMSGGHCGFGLGATPTAVANMEALVSRFGASPQAFLVVPMVGAFFIDISNTLVIQIYLSLPFVN